MNIPGNVLCFAGVVATNFLGDVCIDIATSDNTKAFLITSFALKTIACVSCLIIGWSIPYQSSVIFESYLACWIRDKENLILGALLLSTVVTLAYALFKELASASKASTVALKPWY